MVNVSQFICSLNKRTFIYNECLLVKPFTNNILLQTKPSALLYAAFKRQARKCDIKKRAFASSLKLAFPAHFSDCSLGEGEMFFSCFLDRVDSCLGTESLCFSSS